MSETVTTIMELAAKRFERDATKLSAEQDIFDALGIDSMLAMELLTELEDHFGRVIEATLVSHRGEDSESATIRKDGREMAVLDC